MKLFRSWLFLFLMSSVAQAVVCQQDQALSKIEWKAFKTAKKVGVKGEFKKFKIEHKPTADILTSINGATIEIDSSSVATMDPSRDKKIVDNFFSTMAGDKKIKATIQNVEGKTKGKLDLVVHMNGVSNTVPMNWEIKDNVSFEMSGNLNVLGFSMWKQLEALNKACLALHEGNTWADVDISFKTNFNCK